MTSPGPCRFHCGSGVSVGAKVDVGRGVSEGGKVGVFVGKNMGVTVAGCVGEESEAVVRVASIVGVDGTGTISVNPPHPRRKRPNNDIPITIILVIASHLAPRKRSAGNSVSTFWTRRLLGPWRSQ